MQLAGFWMKLAIRREFEERDQRMLMMGPSEALNREEREERPRSAQRGALEWLFLASFAAFLSDLGG
jgi:hypothetical protein